MQFDSIDWLIEIWGFFSSNYPEWLLHCKLGRFIKFLKLDLMRLNSCIVWIIGRWFKMNWIYNLNWSLGLNNLIWREIRFRLKGKSKIDLDKNLGFQSNLMKNKSQHLFTMEIVF